MSNYDAWRRHLENANVAQAIKGALERDESIAEALGAIDGLDGEGPSIETVGDARALLRGLDAQLKDRQFDERRGFILYSDLQRLVALFGRVYHEEAADLLAREGLTRLVDLYDQRIRLATAEQTGNKTLAGELMAILEQLARWGDTAGATRIVDAAGRCLAPDSFMWHTVFEAIEPSNPVGPMLLEALGDPQLLDQMAGTAAEAAFLAFANRHLTSDTAENAENSAERHPYTGEAGHERLKALLADPDWDRSERAEAAAHALSFVARGASEALEALYRTGIGHPVASVRLICARQVAQHAHGFPGADALTKDAVEALVEMCRHPSTTTEARTHLEALGLPDLVPGTAKAASDGEKADKTDKTDLQAMATLCDWLASPDQYGRPPDHVEIADRRTLQWPPTRDTRHLWLVRYEYRDHDEHDAGLGLVGSDMPFVLYEEVTPETAPEVAYALHCVWELQVCGDPRAPEERTVQKGLELLGW